MRAERGFTLAEVMVALVIVALSVGVLLETMSGALSGTDIAVKSEEAVSRARSRLDAARIDPNLAEGSKSGDDGGGFSWRLDVTPVPGDESMAGAAWRRFDVVVTESWGQGLGRRSVTLATRSLMASRVPMPRPVARAPQAAGDEAWP